MSPSHLRRLCKRANQFLWKQRPEEALRVLSDATRLHPDHGRLRRERALALSNLGRHARALAEIRIARKRLPSDPTVAIDHGCILVEAGCHALALPILRRAVRAEPPDAYAWAQLGDLYAGRGDARRAVNCYGRALRIDPGQPHALFGIAESLTGKEAIPAWKRALAVRPDFAHGWAELGHILLYKTNRDQEALRAFRRAARLEGRDAYLPDVARALYFCDRIAEAHRTCRKAIRTNPENAYAWAEIAGLYSLRSRPRMARRAYDRAVALAPRDGSIRYHLADHLRGGSREDLQRSLREFRIAESLGEPTVHCQVQCLMTLGRFREAGRLAGRALRVERDPGWRRILLCDRAWCYLLTKQPARALADFRRVGSRGLPGTSLGLAKAALALGRDHQARAAIRRLMRLPRRSAQEFHECARLLRRLGDTGPADTADAKGLLLDPHFRRRRHRWFGEIEFVPPITWAGYKRWLRVRRLEW